LFFLIYTLYFSFYLYFSPLTLNGTLIFKEVKAITNQQTQFQIFCLLENVNVKINSVIHVNVLGCPLGLVSYENDCVVCGSNQYTFDGNECLNCPSYYSANNTFCSSFSSPIIENHKIHQNRYLFNTGFWVLPNLENPKVLLQCPYVSNCSSFECYYDYDSINKTVLKCQSNNSSKRIDKGDEGSGFCGKGLFF
jgi:hypothetical protein